MIKPALILAPVADPLTLAEVKQHLRVDFDDDDALLTVLIAAATTHLDGYGGILGKCLMRQTWRVSADRFNCQTIRLPFSEIVSVVVNYHNSAMQEMLLADTEYEVLEDSLGAYVYLSPAFPNVDLANTKNPAWVDLVCGTENASDVPQSLLLAMKMMIAHWYEHRSGNNPNRGLPAGVETLLARHRKWRI
ncbi:head-tail connector protein [Maritalea sp.]|uniref:head-tail connector protein n=1 Tax=Maritalea sp. TaxID=2003361 RepID=UPI003EF78D80